MSKKEEKQQKEINSLLKYRFIVLGISAVFLIVFGIVMVLPGTDAEKIVLYLTAGIILIFAAVRFIPMMKHLSDKRRLIVNAIEIFSNFLIAIAMIYMAGAMEEHAILKDVYKYLLVVVLFARGVLFFVEGLYFEGEKEPTKFIAHIIFICFAAAMVARTDFDLTTLKYLLGALALLAGAYCTGDTYISFNRYRKLYVKKEKVVKDKAKKEKEKAKEVVLDEQDGEEITPIIDQEIDNRDYVN